MRAIVKSDSSGNEFPDDFNTRCGFIITGEKGSTRPNSSITYGSYVRLKHKATGYTLVALREEDDYDSRNCYNTVALRNILTPQEELASTWCVAYIYIYIIFDCCA